MERILQQIASPLIGSLGYYSSADLKAHVKRISGWLRRRIRQLYWKRVRRRGENLIQLGIPKDQAWPWANTRKGYWHTADSQILKHSLTNHYLESIGFPDVLNRFEVLHERIGRTLKIRALIGTR